MEYSYFGRDMICDQAAYDAAGWSAVAIAYNKSSRVVKLSQSIPAAARRVWIFHEEYDFDPLYLPEGESVDSSGRNESEFADELIARLSTLCGGDLASHRIAVDITGFMRPELVCLVQKLKLCGAREVDFLYAEPTRYIKKGRTQFARGNVKEVRQVLCCEGVHTLDSRPDLLLMGTGYDDLLMSAVAEAKSHSQKMLLLGFPSLAPDMYQENVWRVSRASESIGSTESRQDHLFAPANDPFVTASVVSSAVRQALARGEVTNIYLSPLGTKVQVLGFALFYAFECLHTPRPISVVLPFTDGYDQKTSEGMTRTWRYSVDFGAFNSGAP